MAQQLRRFVWYILATAVFATGLAFCIQHPPLPSFDAPTAAAQPPGAGTELPKPPAVPALPTVTPAAGGPLPPPSLEPPKIPEVPAAPKPVELHPPKPAESPHDVKIFEPVATVHRFPGRFLHAGDNRVFFLQVGEDGQPAVVCRALEKRPPLLVAEELFRVPVPAGNAKWCFDRLVVAGTREVVAIDYFGTITWRFTLPGKDTRESLVGVLGLSGSSVMIASQFHPGKDYYREESSEPVGRVFWFDLETGRLRNCVNFHGGFGDRLPLADAVPRHYQLYAIRPDRVVTYNLRTGQQLQSAPFPADANSKPARPTDQFGYSGLLLNGKGLSLVLGSEVVQLSPTLRQSAPPAFWDTDAYQPVRSEQPPEPGHGVVALRGREQLWSRTFPAPVTAPPGANYRSLFVVAGKVLYRLDRRTGEVCWKKTLPLLDGEEATDLAGYEGWVRVSGDGFFVLVRNQPDPPPVPRPSDGIPLAR